MQGNISDYEIILVGNFDPNSKNDPTPNVVRELATRNDRIVPLTIPKDGMMGWDARQGLDRASGQYIAIIDGDGQMPPKDIVRLTKIMETNEFDMAKTFRVRRDDGFFRKLASFGFNWLFQLFFPGTRFHDINSKPKIFSRKAIDQMRLVSNGWFFDGEVMLQVHRRHMTYAEIPTVFHENEWRGSFVKLWTIFEMIGSLVRFRFRSHD